MFCVRKNPVLLRHFFTHTKLIFDRKTPDNNQSGGGGYTGVFLNPKCYWPIGPPGLKIYWPFKFSTGRTIWERSGSVVECLTGDRGAAGSSLNGITALWSLSKIHLS